MSDEDRNDIPVRDALLQILTRLNDGDLSARMPPSLGNDIDERIANSLNSLAETLGQALSELKKNHGRLEADVWELSELFLRFAQGDFSVRTNRGDTGAPMDVLSYLFDNTVQDVSALFSEVKSQRTVVDSMLDSMVEAVFLLSPEGTIQKSNESATQLLGWSAGELIGTSFADVLAPRDRSFSTDLQDSVSLGPIRNRDTLFQTKSGEIFPLVLNGSAVKDEEEGLIGVVLAGRDERELRKARSQLQLTDRLATMGSLAAGVAHEINNPLSFVVSNLEFVLEELEAVPEQEPIPIEIREEIRSALRTSYKGTERVAGIVRDLKSISRVDSDALTSVNINGLLDSATAMLRHEIRHRAILKKDYGTNLFVYANEARVMQVFLNLIQNAAQASPVGHASKHEIVLRTRLYDESSVLVEVADTGCGISDDDIATIFDEFFTTKEVGVGTGLGLSICKRLVQQMNGYIKVTSSLGNGTTFQVRLPVPTSKTSPVLKDETAVLPRSDTRRRVLVIDDETHIGDAIRRLLRRDYDVDVTSCGTDALALFKTRQHELILCDVMMPEMSGPAFARELEARFPDNSARIIFMTGGEVSDLLGSAPSLEKPFSPTALRALLASH